MERIILFSMFLSVSLYQRLVLDFEDPPKVALLKSAVLYGESLFSREKTVIFEAKNSLFYRKFQKNFIESFSIRGILYLAVTSNEQDIQIEFFLFQLHTLIRNIF